MPEKKAKKVKKKKGVARKVLDAVKPKPKEPVTPKPPVKPDFPRDFVIGGSFQWRGDTWSVLGVGEDKVVAQCNGAVKKISKAEIE